MPKPVVFETTLGCEAAALLLWLAFGGLAEVDFISAVARMSSWSSCTGCGRPEALKSERGILLLVLLLLLLTLCVPHELPELLLQGAYASSDCPEARQALFCLGVGVVGFAGESTESVACG